MKTTPAWIGALLILSSLLGCQPSAPSADTSGTGAAQPAQPQAVVAPAPAPPVAPLPPPPVVLSANGNDSADTASPVVAETGVGARGHYNSNDYISTVVSTRFRAEETIVFAQVKRGLDTFRAINERYPKSHEEFWKAVIEENLIRLPQLSPGEQYYYDAESAERTRGEEALFVLKPKPN
ncbi:MAG: hypothetical protein KDA41_00495 [Planctomycetales bacterium]|nr:hypothetical protein [Planctomycetales bacterium]